MKVNKNILGKNWVTLADGTGKIPDNQLLVLTKETADTGDIITVSGVIKNDVNIGAGYEFKVLIDNAKLIKK